MKFFFFAVVLISISSSLVIGQPIDKHGPFEVYYGIDIIEGKNNRLFLSTSGGLYTSDNLGDEWKRFDAYPNSIYFEPHFTINEHNGTVYAWDRWNGIYTTTDNGETWKTEIIIHPNGQLEPTALGVDGDTVFIGTKTGLHYIYGSDFLRFTTSISTFENKEITALHVDGEMVIATTRHDGIYLSEDVGKTWHNISTGLPAGFDPTGTTVWQHTIFAYAQLGGLYYTNDKGANWQTKTTGLGPAQINKLCVDAGMLYAATNGYDKVYRSDLGNGPWTLIDSGIPDAGTTTSLFVAGNLLIVPSWHGIYKSIDGGGSFFSAYNGVTDAFVFNDMQATSDGTVWAVASHTGLYKKEVGQELFVPVERIIGGNCGSGLVAGEMLPFVQPDKVRMLNTHNNVWEDELPIDNIVFPTRLIRKGSDIFLSCMVGGIYRYNGTATWQSFNDGLVSLMVTDFSKLGDELLVGTEDGLFSRAVGDPQWHKISFSEAEIGIRKLFVKDNTVLITASDYSTYLSKDNCVTWEKVAEMDGLDVKAYASAEGILYAATIGKLFLSSDGGQTWAQRTLPDSFITSMVVANGKLFLATSERGIFSTSLKLDQQISFSELPENSETPGAHAFGEGPIDLTAFATSNLPVTYTSSNEDVAAIREAKAVIKGVGQTTITAIQSGNDIYSPATIQERVLIVEKGSQSIIFDPFVNKTYGDASFAPAVSNSTMLEVSLTSSDPSVAEIVAGEIFIRKAGMVEITASQPGNAFYNSAVPVTQFLTIDKASQEIVFEIAEEKTVDDAPFQLQATASSTLPVSFQVKDEGIVMILGNEVTITGTGTVTITAGQAGDENYKPATSVSRVLVVNNVLGVEEGLPFSFYPNPTPEILTVETSEGIRRIEIFDDKGQACRVLWNGNRVDLSQLSAGFYYVRISIGDHTYNTKVIKI
jgi:photosystem II stability/assembly factor-like uncharacterized protein